MSSTLFKIAIVGRENVGKSSIFNKLCKKNLTVVSDQPGITRDYIRNIGNLFDSEFEVIDTAGWSLLRVEKDIDYNIKQKTLKIIEEVDMVFFVVDAKTMLSEEDIFFARKIKKLKKKVLLLANKSESKRFLTKEELFRLGFGEGIFISAEHKLGFDAIYAAIAPFIKKKSHVKSEKEQISIAIVGRPNVGKSTFFNSILGFERSLVSTVAGTTRDCVMYNINIYDTNINLIDTAGIRKRTKISEGIEKISINKTIEAVRTSDLVLLIMDSNFILEKQDLILANLAFQYNKLLIPIINKQDLIDNLAKFKQKVSYLMKKRFPKVKDFFPLYISAKKSFSIKVLFKKVIGFWKLYKTKIPTSKLNNWLSKTLKTYNLPITKYNTKLKVKYVKQNNVLPLAFSFFINISSKIYINKNFETFLINSLKKEFALYGMPIKAYFILSKNPFIKRITA